MTAIAPTYDLVLLLDPQAEDDARAKIVADARAAIEAQGELLRHDEWGTRALTYPIDKKTVAEYHMMQFHAGSADLLRHLDRSLRLADEAIRFRIVKLKAGVPDPPDMRSSAHAAPPATAAPQAPPAPADAPPADTAPTTEAAEPAPAVQSAPAAEAEPAPAAVADPAPAVEAEPAPAAAADPAPAAVAEPEPLADADPAPAAEAEPAPAAETEPAPTADAEPADA